MPIVSSSAFLLLPIRHLFFFFLQSRSLHNTSPLKDQSGRNTFFLIYHSRYNPGAVSWCILKTWHRFSDCFLPIYHNVSDCTWLFALLHSDQRAVLLGNIASHRSSYGMTIVICVFTSENWLLWDLLRIH